MGERALLRYVTGITERNVSERRRSAMTRTPAPNPRTVVTKPQPVTVVLPCCSDEEYAQRIAKPNEARDYFVPGYLAA
jgi:hypothetical protein